MSLPAVLGRGIRVSRVVEGCGRVCASVFGRFVAAVIAPGLASEACRLVDGAGAGVSRRWGVLGCG